MVTAVICRFADFDTSVICYLRKRSRIFIGRYVCPSLIISSGGTKFTIILQYIAFLVSSIKARPGYLVRTDGQNCLD